MRNVFSVRVEQNKDFPAFIREIITTQLLLELKSANSGAFAPDWLQDN